MLGKDLFRFPVRRWLLEEDIKAWFIEQDNEKDHKSGLKLVEVEPKEPGAQVEDSSLSAGTTGDEP